MSASIRLASGYEMPIMGFGLFRIPPEDTAETVYNAIKSGYRLLDGAYRYENEKEAGIGVQRAIKDGIVRREELFITSKLWNTYHSREHAIEMGKRSNEAWGVGYLDLYLIHYPIALKYIDPNIMEYPGWTLRGKIEVENTTIRETWEALETLVDEEVVRSIGLSSFSGQLIHDIKRYARHPISALQIEHHPYLTQTNLIGLCGDHHIAVTGHSSFGPTSYTGTAMKAGTLGKTVKSLLLHDEVLQAAEKHGKTPAQVLLRWATQRGVAVIPKSTQTLRMVENLESMNFQLSEEEIYELSGLDCKLRFNDPYLETGNKDLRIFT